VKRIASHLRAHPHLLFSAVAGLCAGLAAAALPYVQHGDSPTIAACLVGWNVGAWFYLAWTAWTMTHSDHGHLIRIAKAQAEGADTMVAVLALAALASLVAAISELSAAKHASPGEAWPHVLFTLVTVASSWLLVPTLFTLYYASLFHTGDGGPGGLVFPRTSKQTFEPDYSDFLYFSFTIAVASQTSDVVLRSTAVRRTALAQSVLSFFFNVAVLGLSVNIAAGLVGS